MPFRVETGAQCQSYLFWILEMDGSVLDISLYILHDYAGFENCGTL